MTMNNIEKCENPDGPSTKIDDNWSDQNANPFWSCQGISPCENVFVYARNGLFLEIESSETFKSNFGGVSEHKRPCDPVHRDESANALQIDGLKSEIHGHAHDNEYHRKMRKSRRSFDENR